MATTALQAFPYPAGSDSPAGMTQILALATAVEKTVVMVFASAAARTSAFSAAGVSPTEGMLSWLSDSNWFEFYDGSNWRRQGIAATADVTTNQNTTSSTFTDLTTPGPAVSLVLASGQKAEITVNARATHSVGSTSSAIGSFAVSGAATIAAADVDGFETNALTTSMQSRSTIFTAAATGTFTFTMKYRSVTSGTASFFNRRIIAKALG
jgi:hypothetical protein